MRFATSRSSWSPIVVAERVVDALEVIEVDEHHREQSALALRAGDAAREAVGEQEPVRQPGQRIARGELRDSRLGLLPLGDV